eukprot:11221137-Lingulodinium_polyedra.AAC.1
MLFPIFFGHLTFASHRCWTIYIKKGVYLAAEAWRRQYGEAVHHEAKRDKGGQALHYVRPGVGPYVLGGRRQAAEPDGRAVYVSPDGLRLPDIVQAYEYDVARKEAAAGDGGHARQVVSFLEKFLQESGAEQRETSQAGFRVVVTTSTLEDWLFRGDHPVLACMSLQ